MRLAALTALAGAALLAACGTPPDLPPGSGPAAARFAPGGGPVSEVRMDTENPEQYLGVWSGPYAPMNMRYYEVSGPPVGRAVLTITDVENTLAHGIIRWEEPGKDYKPQKWTGAFTLSGHIMVLNAHAIQFSQDGQNYMEADMMLPDGKFYRMRLTPQA